MKIELHKLLFCLLFLTNCNSQNGNKLIKNCIENIECNKLVENWNNAYNSKDIGVLTNLYDNSIFYYGVQKDKKICIEDILTTYKKSPEYYQQIFGDIENERINENEIKFSFVKRVTNNYQTKDYPSYLIISNKKDSYKIVTEGDLVTDKTLAEAKEIQIPKDAVKGDFNGDGKLDYTWLVAPKINGEGDDCVGSCISYIKFSDKSIPSIKIENCISGSPTNLGDLNKNGMDEIGLLPGWFTSCWRNYNVYTLKNTKWIFAVPPFSTHCNQWDEGIKPIEIDLNKKGNVLIKYSEHTGVDIVTKTKSISIK